MQTLEFGHKALAVWNTYFLHVIFVCVFVVFVFLVLAVRLHLSATVVFYFCWSPYSYVYLL